MTIGAAKPRFAGAAVCWAVFGMAVGTASGDPSAPRVELNENFAGCIEPTITGYAVGRRFASATLKIVNDAGRSGRPCVCRGGFYYFEVYPSDRALPEDSAWMYVKPSFKADLSMGVLPVTPYRLPRLETIRFPTSTNHENRASAWYYITIGCP